MKERIKKCVKAVMNIAMYYRLKSRQNRIDLRIKKKKTNKEKINVVFVCHRPAVWEALHSVYDSLKSNEMFNVSIVAIPNKKELPKIYYNHDIFETEGAEEFWKEYGCINGYDYNTKEWFDLKALEPDYVFFQQPYNITRPSQYKSKEVSKYAKICYVSYFASCEYGEQYNECLPKDFLRDVSLFFSLNAVDQEYISKRVSGLNRGLTKVTLTGYPKYDYRQKYSEAGKLQKADRNDFRIIWTPRWTTNEGLCSFFDYKDRFTEYCENNRDIDFWFRPHPQAFSEWRSTGEFTEEDVEELKSIYHRHGNMHIDQSHSYYPLLYSSDCLITDMSSIVFDYLFTGKPIILCMKETFTNYYLDVKDGLYRVSSWDELVSVLDKLKNGDDPLYEKRKQITDERLVIYKKGAGNRIMQILQADPEQLMEGE